MRAHFPFQALGFQCNPFRALTDEEWAQVALVPAEALAAAQTGHLQIIGPRGYGKTTLLLGLGAHFRRASQAVTYEYLAEGQTRFSATLAGLDIFLLDEAQRLATRERRRLLDTLSQPGISLHLLAGTHQDLGPLFAVRRLPLATCRLEEASATHLRAVLERRLAFFALPGGAGVSLGPEAITYLHATYAGDLRAMELLLYEAFQQLTEPGETPTPHEITASRLARLRRGSGSEPAPK